MKTFIVLLLSLASNQLWAESCHLNIALPTGEETRFYSDEFLLDMKKLMSDKGYTNIRYVSRIAPKQDYFLDLSTFGVVPLRNVSTVALTNERTDAAEVYNKRSFISGEEKAFLKLARKLSPCGSW